MFMKKINFLMVAIVFAKVLGKPEGVAWLAAGFMLIGYIVHLALDEIYSVDVMDTRLKNSFGTALKLVDTRHPTATVGMLAATVAAVMVAPSTRMFVDGISSQAMWAGLQQRLLPGDKWFGVVAMRRQAVIEPASAPATSVPAGTSPISTGSLPEKAAVQAPGAVPATTPATEGDVSAQPAGK